MVMYIVPNYCSRWVPSKYTKFHNNFGPEKGDAFRITLWASIVRNVPPPGL